MTRIRSHGWRESVAAFEKAGFRIDRIKGDHIAMVKEGRPRPVIIPKKKELPAFIIANNIRTAGISKKAYREYLKQKN